jgi:hypothetical protein
MRTKVGTMSKPVYVDKAEVLAMLRSRGLYARADWVDRELPALIDAGKNSALLQMLGIDPAAMSSLDAVPS